MRRNALALSLVLLLSSVGCAHKPAARSSVATDVVSLVRAHFYDAEAAQRWAERHADLASAPAAEARAALAELRASHTDLFTADDPRHAAMRAIFDPERSAVTQESIGIDAVEHDGRWFVRRVFAGGSASAMGVLRGDEIVAVDGKPFQPVDSLRGRSDVSLTLRRAPEEPTLLRTLAVRQEPVRAAWLEAQRNGTRVIEKDGKRVGVVPLYSGAGEEYLEAIEEAILGPLRAADALVLDFRDGYGGCTPEYVRPFLDGVPAIRSRDRHGHVGVYDPQWRKPLVILINGNTRSGKEVVAHALQGRPGRMIVGERSAGAVLGGRLFPLGDGSLLYLAVQDIDVAGQRLEGVGVAPDIVVADQLAYAAGRDVQLEEALRVAASMASASGGVGVMPVPSLSGPKADHRP